MTDARTKSTIHVSNLDSAVTTSVLQAAFIPFGDVVDVQLPISDLQQGRENPQHRGFGYVEYEITDDAISARENMDLSELYGRVIRVNPAKAQREAHQGLGSDIPVWQQEAYLKKYGADPKSTTEENSEDAGEGRSNDPRDAMQGLEQNAIGPQPG